jgi:Trk K+ transport system NAD-binding subunit
MPSSRSGFSIFSKYNWSFLKQGVQDFWFAEHRRLRRVAMVSSIAVAALLLLGTILFLWTYPNSSLRDAVNATIGLLLGGYPDVVGGVEADPQIPSWLLLFSLGLTVAGTAFVGVLYALLTERLLSARFQFTIKRPPVPAEDHVVLYGLGRTGRSIVTWLQKFGQPVVAIAPTGLAPEILPELPVVTGDMASCLEAANWSTARSMILATDDEMQNLELGLLAHTKNVEAGLVIRTFNQRFSDNLAQLLPYAHVLCAHALAAEAFAGAAFGENIAGLFRLYGETVLVTEYCVESGDTLHGLMLAQVAYGYEVMPLLHQNPGGQAKFLPSDDLQLAIGDRLVVLATTEGLRRIEKGERGQPTYGMVVDRAMTAEAVFEGANAIARIVGCDIGKARDFMVSLPVYLPHPLYFHQAKRLLRHLTRNRVDARVVPFAQIANGQLRQ